MTEAASLIKPSISRSDQTFSNRNSRSQLEITR